jgi:hypothetical protein
MAPVTIAIACLVIEDVFPAKATKATGSGLTLSGVSCFRWGLLAFSVVVFTIIFLANDRLRRPTKTGYLVVVHDQAMKPLNTTAQVDTL